MSLRSMLLTLFHLRVDLLSGILPADFPTDSLSAFRLRCVPRATPNSCVIWSHEWHLVRAISRGAPCEAVVCVADYMPPS
jgi:hypothetical protein